VIAPVLAFVAFLAAIAGVLYWRYKATWDVMPPGATDAARFIWCTHWGLPIEKIPIISPVRQRHLNCAPSKSTGQNLGWIDLLGRCVAGDSGTFKTGFVSVIAFPDGVPFSHTALTHELNHVRRWVLHPETVGEDPDVAHGSEGFYADIDLAESTLKAKGL
jgi:hypothetical protein